jgi:hypothetical protein
MADRSPTEHESRGCIRVVKTAALRVRQLTYPMTTGPGEAGILNNLSEEGICFSLNTPYSVKDKL